MSPVTLLFEEDGGRNNIDPADEPIFAATGVAVSDKVVTDDVARETNNIEMLEEGLLTVEAIESEQPLPMLGAFPSHRAALVFLINAFLCQFASFFGQNLTMRFVSNFLGLDPTTLPSRVVLVAFWTIVVFSEHLLLRNVLMDVLWWSGSAGGGKKIGSVSGRRMLLAKGEAGIDRAFALGSMGGSGLILVGLQIWSTGPVTVEMCLAWAFTLAGILAVGCFPAMFLREQ